MRHTLGLALGDLDGLELGMNEVNELGFSDGKGIGSTLVTYDGAEVVSLYGSTDGTADIMFDGLLLGAILGSVDGLELGMN